MQDGLRVYLVEVRRDANMAEIIKILSRMTTESASSLHLVFRGKLVDRRAGLLEQGYHGRDFMLLARRREDDSTPHCPQLTIETVKIVPPVLLL